MLPLSILKSCRCYRFDDIIFEVDLPVFDINCFSPFSVLGENSKDGELWTFYDFLYSFAVRLIPLLFIAILNFQIVRQLRRLWNQRNKLRNRRKIKSNFLKKNVNETSLSEKVLNNALFSISYVNF